MRTVRLSSSRGGSAQPHGCRSPSHVSCDACWEANVVTEVILPHFRVRPFCVVVSSSPWNRRSRVRISEPELTRHYNWRRGWDPVRSANEVYTYDIADIRVHLLRSHLENWAPAGNNQGRRQRHHTTPSPTPDAVTHTGKPPPPREQNERHV